MGTVNAPLAPCRSRENVTGSHYGTLLGERGRRRVGEFVTGFWPLTPYSKRMGWGFRKSINFGPLRINASKSGLGYSIGGRGFRVGRDARGRQYRSFSIPGTGIFNRTYTTLGLRPPGLRRPSRSCITRLPQLPPTNGSRKSSAVGNRQNRSLFFRCCCDLHSSDRGYSPFLRIN